jgi:hypothetical protein
MCGLKTSNLITKHIDSTISLYLITTYCNHLYLEESAMVVRSKLPRSKNFNGHNFLVCGTLSLEVD